MPINEINWQIYFLFVKTVSLYTSSFKRIDQSWISGVYFMQMCLVVICVSNFCEFDWFFEWKNGWSQILFLIWDLITMLEHGHLSMNTRTVRGTANVVRAIDL